MKDLTHSNNEEMMLDRLFSELTTEQSKMVLSILETNQNQVDLILEENSVLKKQNQELQESNRNLMSQFNQQEVNYESQLKKLQVDADDLTRKTKKEKDRAIRRAVVREEIVSIAMVPYLIIITCWNLYQHRKAWKTVPGTLHDRISVIRTYVNKILYCINEMLKNPGMDVWRKVWIISLMICVGIIFAVWIFRLLKKLSSKNGELWNRYKKQGIIRIKVAMTCSISFSSLLIATIMEELWMAKTGAGILSVLELWIIFTTFSNLFYHYISYR